jgi:hypothetical protein
MVHRSGINNIKILFPIFFYTLFYNISFSQEALKPFYLEKPPVIDGILENSEWDNALKISDFKTYSPDYGADVSEKTIAYMAYDKENLYFAVHCYDKEADKIKSSITNRDKIDSDDWICFNIDSFNDHQTLYCFYINALGIQMDSRYVQGNEDISMDYVWYSASTIDENGYHMEICLPLNSIRFSDKNPVEMAIIIERNISRKSERATFPALDPKKGMAAFTMQMQPLLYYNIKHNTLLEVLPALTYSQKYNTDNGNLRKEEEKGNFSLTGKYGLTSDLVLDGTYNPDFSQIESDAGQVDINLRYDLFYPEKRPFFLEGSENFKVGSTYVNELDPVQTFVNTRTIINPISGIKLTGKLGEKNTLALLYAIDELPEDQNEGKYTHNPIIRFKRSLDNDSYIGGIYTGRESQNHYNRVMGIDGVYRVNESSLLEYNALYSGTKLNDTTSKMEGHTLGIFFHEGSRDFDYGFTINDISKNFITETGYITRNGIFCINGLIRKKLYPGSSLFRGIFLELLSGQTNDKYSNLWETYNYFSIQGNMWGSTAIKIKYSYSNEIYNNKKFLTGGFHASVASQITKQFYFSSVYRRIKSIYYSDDPFQGKSNVFSGYLIYQPTDKIETNFDFIYSDFYDDSNSKKIYDYPIYRGKLQYQFNKYLFLRLITEYNDYKRNLILDMLASFTYIPGTVIYIGYGSMYDKIQWENNQYRDSDKFMETKRGFFFKASYLWRI